MKVGVYPGTFDPITKGHTNIILRSLSIVDHLIVGIAKDVVKTPMFSLDERIDMIDNTIKHLNIPDGKNISVESFSGLLVKFVHQKKANLIIRGLRAVSDFEYEFQLSAANARLASDIETILLPATESTHFISSSMVKEIGRLGGDISSFVSTYVHSKIIEANAKHH